MNKTNWAAFAAIALLLGIVLVAGYATAESQLHLGTGADIGVGVNSGQDQQDNGQAGLNMNGNSNENVHANQMTGINSFALARTNGQVGSVEDFNGEQNDSFNSSSVMDASNEIDNSVSNNARETTFAQASLGQGWAITSDSTNSTNSSGYFAEIVWVEKTFALPVQNNQTNDTNQSTTANSTTIVAGALKIGNSLYKLNLTSETSTEMVFDAMSRKGNVTGTLTLDQTTSLLGFSVWSGTLTLNSGQSYHLDLATKNSKIKSFSKPVGENEDNGSNASVNGNVDVSSPGQGRALGLFERIRSWFRGGK